MRVLTGSRVFTPKWGGAPSYSHSKPTYVVNRYPRLSAAIRTYPHFKIKPTPHITLSSGI